MKIAFRKLKLSVANKNRLMTINNIVGEYQAAGLILTLRQLYYQLVSRDIIPNKQSEYSKLSTLLAAGRMAGVVDWSAIEDRLREVSTPSSWDNPGQIMDTVINQYERPRMEGQPNYLEVWVEKDALSGVLEQVTQPYHVPIMVNRGYSSVSAMYNAYKRFSAAISRGQKVEILYLGDFDPSGLDMIRDIYDRPLEMLMARSHTLASAFDDHFDNLNDVDREEQIDQLRMDFDDIESHPDCFDDDDFFDDVKAWIKSRFKVTPIALTRDQINQYKPPRNPAKKTDPRSKKFMAEHGGSSWEVDALRPELLNQILTNAIVDRIDMEMFEAVKESEEMDIQKLADLRSKL